MVHGLKIPVRFKRDRRGRERGGIEVGEREEEREKREREKKNGRGIEEREEG